MDWLKFVRCRTTPAAAAVVRPFFLFCCLHGALIVSNFESLRFLLSPTKYLPLVLALQISQLTKNLTL
jgi:hypothetical protein